MNIINLTPHPINILIDGRYVEYEPTGVIPRVMSEKTQIDGDFPFNAVKETYGDITDLPDEIDGTIFVVSKMCADARPKRKDLWYPTDLIRDENGNIVGCDSLACLAY